MPDNLSERSSDFQDHRRDSNKTSHHYDVYQTDEKSSLVSSSSADQVRISSTANHDSRVCIDARTQDTGETDTESRGAPQPSIPRREVRLWTIARILGYISFVLLLGLGIYCFVEASQSESTSVFAFAFSCILDSSGAAIVIWRSFSTDSPVKSRLRELKAQVLLGCLFCFAAMFILVRSMLYLSDTGEQDEHESDILHILLGIGGGLQLFFFVTKTPIAMVLKSPALIADGVNSLAAFVLAATGITVSVLGESSENLAIADDLTGVLVSFLIAGYGAFLLYQVWVDPRASELIDVHEGTCHCRCRRKKENGAKPPYVHNVDDERQSLLPSNDQRQTGNLLWK